MNLERMRWVPAGLALTILAIPGLFWAGAITAFLSEDSDNSIAPVAVSAPPFESVPNREGQANGVTEHALEQLLHLTPFGRPTIAEQGDVDIEDLPESSLSLTLVGTFTHAARARAAALVSVDSGRATYFRVGDQIDAGTTLYDVTASGIVLETPEGLERLFYLHRSSGGDSTTATSRVAQRPTLDNTALTESVLAPEIAANRTQDTALVRQELRSKMQAFLPNQPVDESGGA